MKISMEWLSDFFPTGAPDAKAAADALTHAGLPVESIETHGSDTVIDVEVTSNRSDCLSHAGVARELAAILDLPFRMPEISAKELAPPASADVRVGIEAADLCP